MPATAGKYGSKDALMPSGREKRDASDTQKDLARLTGEIAKELFNTTGPLREAGVGQLGSFLNTGNLPMAVSPDLTGLYAGGRENLESQYNVARNQILNQTPVRGGEMNSALRDLAIRRAQGVGELETNIRMQVEQPLRNQLFSAALGLGFGAPPQAMAGLNMGASQFGNVANRALGEQLHREQAAKEEWQQIGQMVAMGMGT